MRSWTPLAVTALLACGLSGPATAQDAREEPTFEDAVAEAKARRNCNRVDPTWLEQANKRWPEVGKALEAIVENPDDAARHNEVGNGYAKLMLFDLAERSYACATHRDKKFAPAWNNLGLVYMARRKTSDAIGAFQKAAQIDPYDARTFYHLAMAYDMGEQYDQALQSYEWAITLDPQIATVRHNPRVVSNPHQIPLFLRRLLTDRAVRYDLRGSPVPAAEPEADEADEPPAGEPEGD